MTARYLDDLVESVDDLRLIDAMETNFTEALAVAVENLGWDVYQGPGMTRFIPNPHGWLAFALAERLALGLPL